MHLNGLVYAMAGSLFLAWNHRKLGLRAVARLELLFGLAVILTTLFYFLDVFLDSAWPVFFKQFSQDPAIRRGLKAKLDALLGTLPFYTHTVFEATLTLSFLLCAFWYLFRHKTEAGQDPKKAGDSPVLSLISYTFFLIFSYLVLLNRNTKVYYLIFLPFFLMIVLHRLMNLEPGKILSRLAWNLWFLVLLGCGLHQAYFFLSQPLLTGKPSLAEDNLFLSSFLKPEHRHILAPESFIFQDIGKRRILGLNRFMLADRGVPWTDETLLLELEKESVSLMIFEKKKDFTYYYPENEFLASGHRCLKEVFYSDRYLIWENLCLLASK